jgi:CAAX prenyl protease-like protein
MPDVPSRPLPGASPAGTFRGDTAAYIAPFLLYVGLMGIENTAKLPAQVFYPIRCALCAAVVLWLSSRRLGPRPTRAVASIALGAAVFLVWIGPDVLFGYRHFWLFENSLFGPAASAASPELRASTSFRLARTLGSTLVVPVVEELFWRGWLMRWLIHHQFTKVPLGAYAPSAFWIVALLFASEHGPYWEVGLAAGILYNWWMLRTHNLADCILAHTVTNGLLSAYVLVADQWQYWL